MARTLGVLWLACALAGPIVGIVGSVASGASGAPVDLGWLTVGLVVVNAVYAAVAWLYVWSYRTVCRDTARFALKSLLPILVLDVPLLCFARFLVVSSLDYPPGSLDTWEIAVTAVVCFAAVCAMLLTVIAWMGKQHKLLLAALAPAGIALGAIGLAATTEVVIHGFGRIGIEVGILSGSIFLSAPSLWMAVAFLRCLKIEPTARNAS